MPGSLSTVNRPGCRAMESALFRRSLSSARQEPVCAYFTTGISEKVWNGGGEDTVHSSVVAPSPQ